MDLQKNDIRERRKTIVEQTNAKTCLKLEECDRARREAARGAANCANGKSN